MSFSDREVSRIQGRPVELYEFKYGPSPEDTFLFTSADHDIEVDGKTYLATTIGRESFSEDGNPDDGEGLTINMGWYNDLVELYRASPFEKAVSVKLKATHIDDPTEQVITLWTGRVTNLSQEYPQVKVSCERYSTTLKRTGARQKAQRQCRHDHYGIGCYLDREEWCSKFTVISFSSNEVTLKYVEHGEKVPTTVDEETEESVVDIPGNWFLAGFLTLAGQSRMVVGQEPYTPEPEEVDPPDIVLTLSRGLPILADAVSTPLSYEVKAYPGCDLLRSTCSSKFNNEINYGGVDNMPFKGPFEGNSLV